MYLRHIMVGYARTFGFGQDESGGPDPIKVRRVNRKYYNRGDNFGFWKPKIKITNWKFRSNEMTF